jgi:hypothetical protein
MTSAVPPGVVRALGSQALRPPLSPYQEFSLVRRTARRHGALVLCAR